MALLTLTLHLVGTSPLRKWGERVKNSRRLLLITAPCPGEKLIKVGNNNNNNNKDYLCHHSYANNSNGVLRGARGRNKYPPAFILQKTEGAGLFNFFSSPSCFSEKWRLGGGGRGEFCTGEARGEGRSEKQVCYCNRAYEGVKRRAVCRSHARLHDSQNTNPPDPPPPPPPLPCSWNPHRQLALWNSYQSDGESPRVTSRVGDSIHLGLIGTLTCGRRQNRQNVILIHTVVF